MTSTPQTLCSTGLEYEIIEVLKKDKYKEIYRAYKKELHSGLQEEVILKCFPLSSQDYDLEFQSLKTRSKYCAKFLGCESFLKRRAFVLESVKGISLLELISHFNLEKGEVSQLLSSIYEGLCDLKRQNLCHGDLSLNNVLVDEAGEIKFIDFGLANYSQGVRGTEPFIAPELLKGSRTHFASDLFSLGVLQSFFEKPHLLNELKNKTSDFFISTDNSLLFRDPAQRTFKKQNSCDVPSKKSLGFKVKEVLTNKNKAKIKTALLSPAKRSLKKRHLLACFMLFLVTNQPLAHRPEPSAFVKIQTHHWHLIEIGEIKKYAPLELALKPGTHLIKWSSHKKEGEKLLKLKENETLILKDEDF